MKYNKFGNIKTLVDGIKFDSKKEAKRYLELKMLQRCGKISNLTLQPSKVLQNSFKDYLGKSVREIKYICDFSYTNNGQEIWEDVKGHKTDIYKLKKKLFLFKYPDIIFIES